MCSRFVLVRENVERSDVDAEEKSKDALDASVLLSFVQIKVNPLRAQRRKNGSCKIRNVQRGETTWETEVTVLYSFAFAMRIKNVARSKAKLQAKNIPAPLSHIIATQKVLKLMETRFCREQVTIQKMFQAFGVQQVYWIEIST